MASLPFLFILYTGVILDAVRRFESAGKDEVCLVGSEGFQKRRDRLTTSSEVYLVSLPCLLDTAWLMISSALGAEIASEVVLYSILIGLVFFKLLNSLLSTHFSLHALCLLLFKLEQY